MLQQQHVLSVSVADSMMYRAELNPACHSSTLAGSCSRVPTFLTDPTLLVTVSSGVTSLHLYYILVLHLSTNVVLYLFVYRRDDATNAVLT